MKRFAPLICLLAVALMLPGCPIYGEDEGCVENSDCPTDYLCDDVTGLCRPGSTVACDVPSDCGPNETCGRNGLCHKGDCNWAEIGCIVGYTCSRASGAFRCTAEGGSDGGAGGQGGQPGTATATGAGVGGSAASGGAI